MDVSPQAVAQWEKGNPEFSRYRLIKLANLLDVDPEWLDGSKGDDGDPINLNTGLGNNREIQLVPKELAVLFATGIGFKQFPIGGYGVVVPSAELVGRGFAIRATEANEIFDFQPGDIGIFDNGLSAQEGDCVVAFALTESSARVVFARCMAVHRDNSTSGWARHVAAFPGSTSEPILKSSSEANIIGVLVEHRRFFRQPAQTAEGV